MSLERPPRLFIPGPVEVEPEILQAGAQPMIGHRDEEFLELAAPVHDMLKKVFRTEDPVCIATSSATGVMEAAVRNCVRERVLCCVNGAFSERWHEICTSNGLAADRLDVEWGKAVRPEAVKRALAEKRYDAVTLVHNETSTGVMSPLAEIAAVVKSTPEVLLLVDAVTSFAVVPIETAKLRIDVLLAGSQKGLALPPGLAVFSVSKPALERAKQVKNRGTYGDFIAIVKGQAKNQTPNTPAVSLIYALARRLRGILADEAGWYREHQARADLTRKWAREHFAIFPEAGFESVSLTCVKNTRGISVEGLNRFLRDHGMLISNGYGDLKEKTFRIGHMGANPVAIHKELLDLIAEFARA
ncbi:MAG: alanine--glyoxylate aminotransferase family protein [Planctomycetes bacterium]|nr:alanine--glyoxylate aminotransferase family protein [Planctomycetota bacterium]